MNEYVKKSLQRQMQFIATSCAAFDAGQENESLRIAVALRVIFHDTGSSTSILKQLGIKETVYLLSIAPEIADRVPAEATFAMAYPVIFGSFIRPNLEANRANDLLVVAQWLDQRVMLNKGIWFSRNDIILKAANEDGGAHLDPQPSNKTQAMKTPWLIREVEEAGQKKQEPLTDNHFPILRAMGHEVLSSPELMTLLK
jgi:hypothetical protein